MAAQAKKDSTHEEAGAALGVADADSLRVNVTCFRQICFLKPQKGRPSHRPGPSSCSDLDHDLNHLDHLHPVVFAVIRWCATAGSYISHPATRGQVPWHTYSTRQDDLQ